MRDRQDLIDVIEDLTRQFAYKTTSEGTPCLSTGGLSALEAAFDVLGWNDPHPVPESGCSVPGCPQWGTCGTPTPDGYKWLCSIHAQQLRGIRSGIQGPRSDE